MAGTLPTSPVGSRASAHPASFSGHYYVWAYYQNYGSPTSPNIVYANIETPSSGPAWGDRWAQLVSTYDNLGYYDQIGIAACFSAATGCQTGTDNFTVDWEQGSISSCGSSPVGNNLNWIAATLQPLTNYTIAMSLDPATQTLTYLVTKGNSFIGATVFSTAVTDASTFFTIQQTFNCPGGGTNKDTTVGEEVYALSGPQSFPQWDFTYSDVSAGTKTAGGTTWVALSTQIGNYWGLVNTGTYRASPPLMSSTYNNVEIVNVALSLNWGYDAYAFLPGGGFTESGDMSPGLSTTCSLSAPCADSMTCSAPSGWGAVWSYTGPGAPPGNTSYGVSSLTTTAVGNYYGGCTLTLPGFTPTEYTTWIWYLQVT